MPSPPVVPEPPLAANGEQHWPAWFFPAGLFGGLALTMLLSIPVFVLGDLLGDVESPWVTIIGTLMQSIAFVAVSIALVSTLGKFSAAAFGLVRTRFWPAVGWSALAYLIYVGFAAAYSSIANPVEDTTPDLMGASDGDAEMLLFVLVVVVLAPFAEEFFFRGFLFRSLIGALGVGGAALVSGTMFGIVHWDFATVDRLLIVPILLVLGVILCLLYAKTKSLFPCIALHAVNNAAAAGYFANDQKSDFGVAAAGVCLVIVLLACVVLPRLLPERRVHAAASRL